MVRVCTLGHIPMVILACIVEMHTLNLLMCGYRLGTTLYFSVFRSMICNYSGVFSLPRLNTPKRLCTQRFQDLWSTSVVPEKSAYLSWGVKCELKVSTSLSTPLHSSQIIDLPPPKKKIVLLISIILAVMFLCV